MKHYDLIIIGAGAAGMMAAMQSGKRGLKTLILEKNEKPGKKILVSGGGRCNFTNLYASPENYISENPHFCKSALAQYSQWDFLDLIQKHDIEYHEKEAGQLFCDHSAKEILKLFQKELDGGKVEVQFHSPIQEVEHDGDFFKLSTGEQILHSRSLLLATGGLSYPNLGGGTTGYKIAQKLGHSLVLSSPALVPLTLSDQGKRLFGELSGTSIDVEATAPSSGQSFQGKMLFTHRGISGPAILQISSYLENWQELTVNLDPDQRIANLLISENKARGKQQIRTVLSQLFPKRLAAVLCDLGGMHQEIGKLSESKLNSFIEMITGWKFQIAGNEGYRTAEVTRGGINTDEVSSKTMESRLVPQLYFAGEILDVTGQLGGFNFQWAWSSGYVAGKNVLIPPD